MASKTLYVVEASSQTDPGRANRHNEDAIGSHVPGDQRELLHSGQLYVLSDGAGGPGAGQGTRRENFYPRAGAMVGTDPQPSDREPSH